MTVYDPDTKKDAREYFELGAAYTEIAEVLGIQRWQTIAEWARADRRAGRPWERRDSMRDDDIALFKILRIQAKTYLRDAAFNSISEALKIYKDTTSAIQLYEQAGAEKKKVSDKATVLDVLGVEE